MDHSMLKDKCIVVLIILLTTSSVANSLTKWTQCRSHDSCSSCDWSNITINVMVKCGLSNVTELGYYIKSPKNVLRLDISENTIRDIPTNSFQNYSDLRYLSLFSNKIHIIGRAAFSGLTQLIELNLQNNLIKQWDTTLIKHNLPKLVMLNVAQNIYWKPDEAILSLPNLEIIYLLLEFNAPSERKSSFECYILHNNKTTRNINHTFMQELPENIKEKMDIDVLLMKRQSCWFQKMMFRDADYWEVIQENGFIFHCETVQLGEDVLGLTQKSKWYYLETNIKLYCWNRIRRIHIITLLEGICAMVFNLIVIITTLRSRVLRESVAHVLVANIAVGDLLVSLYMIIITSTRQMMDSIEYHDLYLPYYCRIVGLFFLLGQMSSPLMSFIMTLERYLAVVYCMRPHIRITRRMTYVAMVIVWSLSLSLAVSFMTSPQFSVKTDTMCVPYINLENQQVLNYVGGIGVALYVAAMALYVHMYVDFQKTNQKTVQLQRENRLARKIALIMFTNIFFFILPMVFSLILYSFQDVRNSMDGNISLKTFGMICLGINSCCNPILFSFRNEKLCDEFKRLSGFRSNIVCIQAS